MQGIETIGLNNQLDIGRNDNKDPKFRSDLDDSVQVALPTR